MKEPDLVPFPQAYSETPPEPLLPPFSPEALEYKAALKAHPRLRKVFLAIHDMFGPASVHKAWDRVRTGDRERFAELFSE